MTANSFWIRFASGLTSNAIFLIFMLAIAADMLFGALRAWRYKKWNSSIGIDGMIRKIGMLACMLILQIVDTILQADVLAWLPVDMQDVLSVIGLVKVGFMEFFGILNISYEITSILKNMLILGIPIPRGIRDRLANWLQNWTEETNVDLLNAPADKAE